MPPTRHKTTKARFDPLSWPETSGGTASASATTGSGLRQRVGSEVEELETSRPASGLAPEPTLEVTRLPPQLDSLPTQPSSQNILVGNDNSRVTDNVYSLLERVIADERKRVEHLEQKLEKLQERNEKLVRREMATYVEIKVLRAERKHMLEKFDQQLAHLIKLYNLEQNPSGSR